MLKVTDSIKYLKALCCIPSGLFWIVPRRNWTVHSGTWTLTCFIPPLALVCLTSPSIQTQTLTSPNQALSALWLSFWMTSRPAGGSFSALGRYRTTRGVRTRKGLRKWKKVEGRLSLTVCQVRRLSWTGSRRSINRISFTRIMSALHCALLSVSLL